MAVDVALRPFRKVQKGRETTKGTLVAATRLMVCDGMMAEKQEHYYPDYPRGVRATTGGAGVLKRKWIELEEEFDLNPYEILWPLLTGVRGNVTPVAGTGDYTWTFTPQLTAFPTLDSMTIEDIASDGTTNHIAGEAGYVMCSKFGIDFDAEGELKAKASYFGRARQTTTPTAALTPYTNRDAALLVPAGTAFYKDTSWSGLGGTQLAGIVKKASFEFETGNEPDWTMDARSDKDFVTHKVGKIASKLSLSVEKNSVGAAMFGNWRSLTREFIRVKSTGPVVGVGVYTVQVDGCYRCPEPPTEENDGEYELLTYNFEGVYDPTGTKMNEFVVVNSLVGVASL